MRNKWTKEKLKKEALKYMKRVDFQTYNHAAYEYARSHDLLDFICKHMTPTSELMSAPRLERRKWNDKNIRKLAQKYKSKSEFKKHCSGAYKAAKKLGILNDLFSIIRKSWSSQELLDIASQYSSRGQFQKGNRKAYEAAHSKGILDEICIHMKRTTRISFMESELMDIVKNIYSEAKTLKNYSVYIPNKPHIKRFEIDIFVKSLNKGIEFDGSFHHSIEGLLRGRKHWPLEDVKNYHQIKDNYFARQGIQILHIQESDWKKNKQECIDRCLKFLSS